MKETLSLSWDAHQNNICSGLSLLQQRGEFVDMTLAADGHHVKVHQMVLSLASPYIKALISSAQCPHPVIFLNNVSYTTLCSILEYIYTGEVHIAKESLNNLMAAGKALHIKGLSEMSSAMELDCINDKETNPLKGTPGHKTQVSQGNMTLDATNNIKDIPKEQIKFVDITMENYDSDEMLETTEISNNGVVQDDRNLDTRTTSSQSLEENKKYYDLDVQYSVSNQGNLQVIVNRCIYNLKYVQKNRNRYWRCVDYAYRKCPANVYTNDKGLLKRRSTHNHPFHDAKILKKLRLNIIFKCFNEAENRALERDSVELIHRTTASDDSE